MQHLGAVRVRYGLSALLFGTVICLSLHPFVRGGAGNEPLEVEQIYRLPADDGKSLTADEIKAFLADEKNHQPVEIKVPVGLPQLKGLIPADNPITIAKAELGRMLYFDKRLSRDKTVSCATCHDPQKGYTDQLPVSTGIKGQKGGRSAPTSMNRVFGKPHQFWDGRAASLEAQAVGPIANPIEMGFTHDEAVAAINGIAGYRMMFEKIFGGPATIDTIGKAIATYERTIISGEAPFDYFTQAEPFLKLSDEDKEELSSEQKARMEKVIADMKAHPLSEAAERGRKLYFGKAECSLCHVGTNLTDDDFYNIGVGMTAAKPDEGRSSQTKADLDFGAFKTPSLRNIALTAPYMHDGSEKTLKDVIDYYNKGGTPNKNLHKRIRKLNLTADEVNDLVAFLEQGLTGRLPKIDPPRLP